MRESCLSPRISAEVIELTRSIIEHLVTGVAESAGTMTPNRTKKPQWKFAIIRWSSHFVDGNAGSESHLSECLALRALKWSARKHGDGPAY